VSFRLVESNQTSILTEIIGTPHHDDIKVGRNGHAHEFVGELFLKNPVSNIMFDKGSCLFKSRSKFQK